MIDSGADVTILAESEWQTLRTKFNKGEAILYDVKEVNNKRIMAYAAKEPLNVLASFRTWLRVKGADKPTYFAEIYVIAGGGKSLLSRTAAIEMKLLRLGLEVNVLTEKKEILEFPCIPGDEVEFDIDESIPPTKNAYYNLPAAYSKKAKERLAEMEKQGIIERVTKAPRYISGMSAVPKGKSDFRLVVNMRGPKKCIKRQYHRLPLWTEMKRKLQGDTKFTKLDLTQAFYHVRLAEKSRDLTTFMTESGMFRFKRLVFGVNCAPEIFQREMERVLDGISKVIVFIDDILIFASSEEELLAITKQVLAALRKNNLTLNEEKCEYMKDKLTFLGHELTADGLNMDSTKVAAIERFREPNTTSELRSFLGLATYVSTFIPHYADLTAPLWAAATKKVSSGERNSRLLL